MTKKKTKPKTARARTKIKAAPAEAQPAAQVAPQPAVAMVGPVGLRTPPGWNRRDANPRRAGPLTKTATLRRGVTWTTSYSDGPVVFAFGVPTLITELEFEVLVGAVDRVDFPDPSSGVRIERSIRKFSFEDVLTGKEIKLPPLPDREVGPLARSLGDQAEAEKRFQGQEFTAR